MADIDVNILDIRRAILNGGDVSVFIEPLRRALGARSVPSISALGVRVALPDPAVLWRHHAFKFDEMMDSWGKGHGINQSLINMAEVVPIGVPFDSPDGGNHVTHIIDRIAPDIITIDMSPLALSSQLLYLFSLLATVGLPMQGQVRDKVSHEVYSSNIYHPYAATAAVIYRCIADKVPLIPVGMPFTPAYMKSGKDQVYDDRRVKESTLLAPSGAVYQDFFDDMSYVSLDVNMGIGGNPLDAVSKIRCEMLIEEAIYVTSRIAETAAVVADNSKSLTVLALIDINHYTDTQQTLEQYKSGIVYDETYIKPRADIPISAVEFIVGKNNDDNAPSNDEQITVLEKAFANELENINSAVHHVPIRYGSIENTLAQIVNRVRNHPETKRSLSVRGAIAMKEVLHGYSDIGGVLTAGVVEKAALTTLPHRIYTQYQGYDAAVSIVGDAVKEVLYGFNYYATGVENEDQEAEEHSATAGMEDAELIADGKEIEQESGDMEAEFSPDAFGDNEHDDQASALLPDSLAPHTQEAVEQEFKSNELFEYVIKRADQNKEHLKTDRGDKPQGKRKGQTTQKNTSRLKTEISEEDLVETLMEMIDAQDKQWKKQLETRDLSVYYHVWGKRDTKPLNKMKQEQYGLKAIVDFLEEEDLLKSISNTENLALTPKAMDVMLEQLISKILSGRQIEHLIGYGATRLSEHSRDTRRYRVGDVFKDISIRHTLKELARQHKQPSEISRHDIRVFIREKERVQSDIILCIDSSGSMGFDHKLFFARLAASGIATSALKKGDRIGVVTFNNLGRAVVPLTEIKEDIFKHIIELIAGGNTNIGDGIKCAAEMLMRERNHNHKFIVLITDGEPTAISYNSYARMTHNDGGKISEKDILVQARKAAMKGIKTSVIHCTKADGNHRGFVKNIARMGMGRVIKVTSLDEIRALMA